MDNRSQRKVRTFWTVLAEFLDPELLVQTEFSSERLSDREKLAEDSRLVCRDFSVAFDKVSQDERSRAER